MPDTLEEHAEIIQAHMRYLTSENRRLKGENAMLRSKNFFLQMWVFFFATTEESTTIIDVEFEIASEPMSADRGI